VFQDLSVILISPKAVMEERRTLPHATAVLVLGICSVATACFFVGFVLGIIGLRLSREGIQLSRENRDLTYGQNNLKAGYFLCIIGTAIGGVLIFYSISNAIMHVLNPQRY